MPHTVAPLLDLVNANPANLPDFLITAVAGPHRRLADELDAILATSAADLHRALADYDLLPDPPRIVVQLRDGDTGRLRRIVDAARTLFQVCLAPDWPAISKSLQADIAQRTQAVGEAGIGAVLETLHPHAVWQADGALRCSVAGPDRSFALGGGGIELHPNFFVQDSLGVLTADHRPPVLLHPTLVPPADRTDAAPDRLAKLIGPARARALRVIGQQPCSTAELAARLGVSPSTASAHAAALRTTGVITTQRQGRRVRHLAAPLGRTLLQDDYLLRP
ncbi:ArsR/SmtB family transcription factor [Kitasatospora sp. NPDC058965]|uniref:ArsR/SmtB family transcription factor n=1 Tax=Kitasatospora sp. NPDC058965 TaxID=3346682 RepID=UPI003676C3D5